MPIGSGSGAGGSEPYFLSLTEDVDIAIAACDEGDTVILEDGCVLVFREASESGLSENGYVIEEPTRGVPLRLATENDLCDIGEQLREGVASLGSGETWEEHKARVRAERASGSVPTDDVSVSAPIMDAGRDGMASGMGMPTDVTTEDLADALGASEHGTPRTMWDEETRQVAERAGLPDDAKLLGAVDGLYVFETASISTQNPNDPNDHYGEWLYDTRVANVVAPDGTRLNPTIHVARNLRASMERDRKRFEEACERDAWARARGHATRVRIDEEAAQTEIARQRYEEEVIEPYERGYEQWREEHAEEAERMAESMRRDRPQWRHQYIDGDVEHRMRRTYERHNRPPEAWRTSLPEYEEAKARGREIASRKLAEEGWDEQAEHDKALVRIKETRDPNGTGGVSDAMRRNYEDAMARLRRYGAEDFVDATLEWGNTLGLPVGVPAEWKRRLGD